MKFAFRPTLEDRLEFAELHRRRSPLRRVAFRIYLVAIAAFLAWVANWYFQRGRFAPALFFGALSSFLLFLAIFPDAIALRMVRRAVRKNPELTPPVEVEVDDAGVHWTGAHHIDYAWSGIRAVTRGERVIVLYTGPISVFLLAKSGLTPAERTELDRLVDSHAPHGKVRDRAPRSAPDVAKREGEIQLRYTPRAGDFGSAVGLFWRTKSPWRWILLGFNAFALYSSAGLLIHLIQGVEHGVENWVFWPFTLIGAITLSWWFPNLMGRLIFLQTWIRAEVVMSLGPGEIRSASAYATSEIPWSRVTGWGRNRRVFSIFLSTNTVLVIPLRAMSGSEAAIAALLASKTAPSRGTR